MSEPLRGLKAPFPWFGGKSRVAAQVWERFGEVPNYVEPFCGSLAVLLARPTPPGVETIVDKDHFVANFWRALQHAPEEVARWADWPVNECDLHARHRWLLAQDAFQQRMESDPDYFDARVAGWWVWGQCCWIGSGWCHAPHRKLPHLGDAGMGVHRPSQQLPHLGSAGMGVHRPSQQLPHLGDAEGGEIPRYFQLLAQRLRRVRVCCGDWSRVLGPTPTARLGLTAVFLDPPYGADADRTGELYAQDDMEVARAARDWAVAHGDDPRMRVALCGYAGEHAMPEGWECLPWKARGGYGSQGDHRGRRNAGREVIWFSPYCLSSGLPGLWEDEEP